MSRSCADLVSDWNTGGSASALAGHNPHSREAVPTWTDCTEYDQGRRDRVVCQAQVWGSAVEAYGEWAREGLEEAEGLVGGCRGSDP